MAKTAKFTQEHYNEIYSAIASNTILDSKGLGPQVAEKVLIGLYMQNCFLQVNEVVYKARSEFEKA